MAKKRNKKYNPNNHRRDPGSLDMAIRLVKPVEEDSKRTLMLDNHAAIEAFSHGKAQKWHFDILASTVDVSLMILNNLFQDASEYKADVKAGWEGMVRARERYKQTHKLGLDGEAFNALKRTCEIYEAVISNVTGAELLKFYKARELAIKGGNYFKGDQDLKRAA